MGKQIARTISIHQIIFLLTLRFAAPQRKCGAADNIILAIVGQTVVNSTFVILLGICANVGPLFSNAHHR
jgi:hypothetical protein